MTCLEQHQQQALQGLAGSYQLGTTLGRGAFGKVLLAVSSVEPSLGWQPKGLSAANGCEVVVKQVCISGLSQQDQLEAINEVKVMQELDHLNIVRYIECIKQESMLHIVMEYCRYGDLSGLIANRARAAKPFTEPEIMFWFVQISLALWQLHSKNILHRDLKSQNIFIAEGAIAKLGDFGISRVLNSETELVKTAIGTPYYLSPEICQDKPYNRKSDCWALGCVLYELASLQRAFDGGSLPALVVKILRGRYPPLPARYSPQLRGLVDALLQQDPQARPSVDSILRMPYVKTHLARYAQHVMRLSQATAGLPSEPAAAAAAAAGAGSQSNGSRADASRNTQQQPLAAAGSVADGSHGSSTPGRQAVADSPGCGVSGALAESEQQSPAEYPGAVQGGTQVAIAGRSSSSGTADEPSIAMVSSLCSIGTSSTALTTSRETSEEDIHAVESSAGSVTADNDEQVDEVACGDEVAGSDGRRGSSTGAPEQQHHQRKRGLLATGWLEKQQAAFDHLQAEMAALPMWSPSKPEQTAAEAALDAAAELLVFQAQLQQQLPPPRLTAGPGTPVKQGRANGSSSGEPAPPAAQQLRKQHAGKQQHGDGNGSSKPRSGGGGAAVARRAASLSPADAVRRERAAWKKKQAREAAEDAARRGARAAELAAAAQERAEVQARQQQQSSQAAAAHRQHMRAVQARLPRGQLAELGAVFRQHLEEQLGAAAAAAGQATESTADDSSCGGAGCRSGTGGGELLVLQESAGGQALLVALEGDADSTSSKAAGRSASMQGGASQSGQRPPVGRRSSSSRLACKSRTGSSGDGSAAASVPASAAASRRSTAEREQREHQPAGASSHKPQHADKPWRLVRSSSRRRSTEPGIEVFCPYGTPSVDSEQQQHLRQLPPLPEHQQQLLCASAQQPEQVQSAAELTFAGHLQLAALSVAATPSSCIATAPCESPQAKLVLQQIRSALAHTAPDDPGCCGSVAAAGYDAGASCMGDTCAAAGAGAANDVFGLPPEVAAAGVGHADACAAGVSAVPVAARIEALRCSLEESLGQEVMMKAYGYVEAMQQACEPAEQGAEDCTNATAAIKNSNSASLVYERLLAELLGHRSHRVLHQMTKLLLLESQAFGR